MLGNRIKKILTLEKTIICNFVAYYVGSSKPLQVVWLVRLQDRL